MYPAAWKTSREDKTHLGGSKEDKATSGRGGGGGGTYSGNLTTGLQQTNCAGGKTTGKGGTRGGDKARAGGKKIAELDPPNAETAGANGGRVDKRKNTEYAVRR